MDDKQRIMVAMGVAMGANCIPCFEHIYEKAKAAGVSDAEIQQINETADKVKNGAAIFLKNAIHETIGLPIAVEDPSCTGTEERCTC